MKFIAILKDVAKRVAGHRHCSAVATNAASTAETTSMANDISVTEVASTGGDADHIERTDHTDHTDHTTSSTVAASTSCVPGPVKPDRAVSAPSAGAASTTNASWTGRCVMGADSAIRANAALRKAKTRLAKEHAAAVKQRNRDALAANIAAGRILAACYDSKTIKRPTSKTTRAARQAYGLRQYAQQQHLLTVSLHNKLNKLKEANASAKANVEAANRNIRFFHKEREEKPQRLSDLSQKLTDALLARDQARDERDRLSLALYELSL